MTRLAIFAVLALAFAACTDTSDLEERVAALEERASPEPWTVLAMQLRVTSGHDLYVIQYVGPHGAVVDWERQFGTLLTELAPGGQVPQAIIKCWASAVVGEPLPVCARGNSFGIE